jgi:pilus assembly protein CpaB
VRRLTPASLTMIMFGVVGLLVAAYIGKSLLAVEDKKPEAPMRNVPMAVADIEPGTVITETHLGMGPFPVDKLTRDTLMVNRVVVGRVAKELIKAAQPIHANQLYKPGELPPLEVAEGMRAVSIEIGEGVGIVDGLIKPGQFVDVLFTYISRSGDDQRDQGGLTMRLFEGVKLIAINRNLAQGRPDRLSNRITLELTEPQANILVLAKDRGTVTLTFNPNGRGSGGLSVTNADRVTLYDILGLKPDEPAPQPFVTEGYRGSGHSTLRFTEQGRRIENYVPPTDRNRNQFVLPNQSTQPSSPGNAPAAPGNRYDDAPPVDADRAVPGPQEVPAATRSPTASRAAPIQN